MSTATMETPIHQQVITFIGKPRKMLIGGRWLEAASGKTFPTYNPATGEVLAQGAAPAPTLTRQSSQHGKLSKAAPGASSRPQNVDG